MYESVHEIRHFLRKGSPRWISTPRICNIAANFRPAHSPIVQRDPRRSFQRQCTAEILYTFREWTRSSQREARTGRLYMYLWRTVCVHATSTHTLVPDGRKDRSLASRNHSKTLARNWKLEIPVSDFSAGNWIFWEILSILDIVERYARPMTLSFRCFNRINRSRCKVSLENRYWKIAWAFQLLFFFLFFALQNDERSTFCSRARNEVNYTT